MTHIENNSHAPTHRRFFTRTPGKALWAVLAVLIPLAAYGQDASTQLIEAAKRGDPDGLRSVLGKGIDVTRKTPMAERR